MLSEIELLEKQIAQDEKREEELIKENKIEKKCDWCKEILTEDYFICLAHNKAFCSGCFLGSTEKSRQYIDVAKCEPHAPVSIMGMKSRATLKRINCEFHKKILKKIK